MNEKMKIFTTLSPSNKSINSQTEAMYSWLSKGYEIYSINTKEEINIIGNIYNKIKFIETNNIFKYNGKNLIKLDAILNAIEQLTNKDEYVGIINSDIILNTKLDILFNCDCLTIATRYELDSGRVYPFVSGYDLFIFKSSMINFLKNDNYVIGMPWWDYWVPIISMLNGINIYHISSEVIYHRTHKTNYDQGIWFEFGSKMYIDIINQPGNNVNIIEFSRSIKKLIEDTQINYRLNDTNLVD